MIWLSARNFGHRTLRALIALHMYRDALMQNVWFKWSAVGPNVIGGGPSALVISGLLICR
jgi:hypothetical protein